MQSSNATRPFTLLTFLFGVAAICLALAGCAVGNRFDFQSVRFSAPKTSSAAGPVAVAVVDVRPDLLSRDVTPDYVGMTRTGVGTPYRVHTRSGAAFSKDLAAAISGSLVEAGRKAEVIGSSFPTVDSAKAALRAKSASRSVLLVVHAWESDTLIRTELTYDLELLVLDPQGTVLASARTSEKVILGGDFAAPILFARKSVLARTGTILQSLFSQPEVATALR